MSTIAELIIKGTMFVYRRMYIKRLQNDGAYESNWYEITPYVSKYGIYRESYGDNIFLGDYQISNLNIELDNKNRKFNKETDGASFFNGFKTRFRTKFKIDVGFIDTDGSETSARTIFGILFKEPVVFGDLNVIRMELTPLLGVFRRYPSSGVAVTTSTTSGMVDRLVKKEQNGLRIFDQFIEGANDSEKYQIDSTSAYTVSSPETPANTTVWDKISDYSLYQDSFSYINSSGNFVWARRNETVGIQWYFNGAGGGYENDYGVNIVSVNSEIAGVSHVWSRVVCEYAADTFYTSEASWTPGDGSNQDLYGDRPFSFTAKELTLAEATAISDALRSARSAPLRRWEMMATFIPHLNLNDKVNLNYIGEILDVNPFRLSISGMGASRTDSGYDVLSGFSGSINLKNVSAKIIGQEIDLDSFICSFEFEEI